MWTPSPDEQLETELQAALARPGASRVIPPRPVAHGEGGTGWLWGRMRTADGTSLGLATIFPRRFFDGAELGWHPTEQLRTLD